MQSEQKAKAVSKQQPELREEGNSCVEGSSCWLNEEFSASGFTQGCEDQQIANRAERPQATGGIDPASGCSCAALQPRQRPGWRPAGSSQPCQSQRASSSAEQEVKL